MTPPLVFLDLRTTDAAASRKFYGELFGWTVIDVPVPMFTGPEGPWGGLTELVEDDERQPQWVPYVEVADLDEAIQKATSLGATLSRGRVELPQGAVAVITDPTGAVLALWQTK